MEPASGSMVAGVILLFCGLGLCIIIFGSIGYYLGAAEKEREILNRYSLRPLAKPRYEQPTQSGYLYSEKA